MVKAPVRRKRRRSWWIASVTSVTPALGSGDPSPASEPAPPSWTRLRRVPLPQCPPNPQTICAAMTGDVLAAPALIQPCRFACHPSAEPVLRTAPERVHGGLQGCMKADARRRIYQTKVLPNTFVLVWSDPIPKSDGRVRWSILCNGALKLVAGRERGVLISRALPVIARPDARRRRSAAGSQAPPTSLDIHRMHCAAAVAVHETPFTLSLLLGTGSATQPHGDALPCANGQRA
jgi:hypothetical protein